MAGEWKFGLFQWNADTETHSDLIDRLAFFLLSTGWEETSYSAVGGLRYFTRADHATNQTWHYTGDSVLQKCGICIDDREITNAGERAVWIKAFLEDEDGLAMQQVSHTTYATIYIDTSNAEGHEFLVIGGEDGFYVEGKKFAEGDVALGMIAVFKIWEEMNGSRDAEVTMTAQGLCMDWRQELSFTYHRNYRFVKNDGTNANKTGRLAPASVRSVTSLTNPAGGSDWARHALLPLDNLFSYSYASNYTEYAQCAQAFATLNNPENDRWKVSPMVMFQVLHYWYYSQYSASADNALGPNTSYSTLFEYRWARKIQRLVVVSDVLPPWQTITDANDGKVYRIVRIPDNGRPCNVGVEWPGAANEVTIP